MMNKISSVIYVKIQRLKINECTSNACRRCETRRDAIAKKSRRRVVELVTYTCESIAERKQHTELRARNESAGKRDGKKQKRQRGKKRS